MLDRITVIISAIIGLFFIIASLFRQTGEERREQQLYAALCLLFGILICVYDLMVWFGEAGGG